MDSTPEPGLRSQPQVRLLLRVLGLVLLPVGLVLLIVGFTRFASAGDEFSSGSPDGFLMFAAGGFLGVIGLGLLSAGFMGTSARYAAGETMPVVKDGAAYLTDGRGVLGIGRTERDADHEPATVGTDGPYCRSCGVRNDEAARFCDSCGRALA